MSEEETTRRSLVIPVSLTIGAIGLIIVLVLGFWGGGFFEPIAPYQEMSDGHPVYYLTSASLWKKNLMVTTVNFEQINVVNIDKSLTVKVEYGYKHTVLLVKHWEEKNPPVADSAEVIVGIEALKMKWEKAIAKALKEPEREIDLTVL